MSDFIVKRAIGAILLSLCAGMLLTLTVPIHAQGIMGYANYTFNGTTTCATENKGPDSIAACVQSGDPMTRTGEAPLNWAGPHCIQTTSSNDKYNSKDWSPIVLLADYLALLPDDPQLTYAYWGFTMKPGLYITKPDLTVHFIGKRNGSGPDQGFLQARFHHKTNGWGSWVIGTSLCTWFTGNYWTITNSAQKEFRFKWAVDNDLAYDQVQFRIHAFNQSGSGGQGDGFQFDGLVVLGTDTPTPVQLTSFTSLLNGSKVDLKWKTATEVNNYGFEVQRSNDAKEWNAIGFVEGRGTVNTPQSYTFSDQLPPALLKEPVLYYRLRQIDRDGREDFSAVVQVSTRMTRGVRLIGNYPNPFNPTTTIAFTLDQKLPVSLAVYDMRGTEVARLIENETLEAGYHAVLFVPGSLSSGTYMYTLFTPGRNFHSRMQITK